MSLHAISAITGTSEAKVDAFEARLRTDHGNVRRTNVASGTAMFTIGEDDGVISPSWSDGRHSAIAFGPSARHITPQTWSDLLAGALHGPTIPGRHRDLLLLVTTPAGSILAVSGQGPHRFYVRDLSETGTVLCSHLESVVKFEHPPSIDRSYEDFFLGFGFIPDDRTIFEGVQQLPALSRWDPDVREMMALEIAVRDEEGVAESETGLLDLLSEAVQSQTQGADRCAVLLGGFDSALVCALLKRAGKDVTAFTFDFGDESYNQPNIETVKHALQIDHHWVPITPERVGAAIRQLPSLLNSPGAQPHYQLHTVLAAEDVSALGFDLLMTGDGCDAIFLGYPTVSRRSALQRRLRHLPGWLNRPLLNGLSWNLLDDALGHVARTARSALRAGLLPYPAAGHLPTQYFDEVSLSRLRTGPRPPLAETIAQTRRRLAAPFEDLDPTRLAFAGNNATGASRIKVDGAIMHTGIPQFSPFQYPPVVKWATEQPTHSLRPSESPSSALGKQVLIDTVLESRLIPEEVVLQPKKSPSTSPIDHWYMHELRHQVLGHLESLPFAWDRTYVDTLLKPKRAEAWYREKVALSPHTLQVIGLLVSYAVFASLSSPTGSAKT